MVDRNIITLLVVPIQHDFGVTDFQLGLLYGLAFATFYTVAGLPLGWAVDRFSRRKVLFWCVLIWSVSAASCGLAGSLAMLFLARTGVGAGEAGLIPAAHSIIPDLFPPKKLSLPLSIYQLGAKMGHSVSFLVGGALTAIIAPAALFTLPGDMVFKGWQIILIIVGLPGLLLAGLIFLVPEPARRGTSGHGTGSSYGEYLIWVRERLGLITSHHVAFLLLLAASTAITSWAPAYLQRHFGLSPSITGAWLGSALLIGSVAGMPLHGWIVDRLFGLGKADIHLRYVAFTTVVGLPLGIAAFLVPSAAGCVILIGAFFFVTASYASLPAVALQLIVPGNFRGKAASILLLTGGLGGISLGPLMVAAISDFAFDKPGQLGLALAWSIAILLPISVVLLLGALAPMRRALEQRNAMTAG